MQPPASRKALGMPPPGNPCGVLSDRRMARALVTRLAEKWRAYLEQRRLHRAVRVVTVAAVLGDRLVFPEERSAVFGVAAGAGFVDGVLHELRRRGRAMRRMAGGAGHLALAQRMMRGLEQIRVLRLVAGGANLDLGRRRQQRIFRRMQLVAARTRHVARCMRARRPIVAPRSIDGSRGNSRFAAARACAIWGRRR